MFPHRLIKLGFNLLYNQLAWTYDLVAWLVSLGQWTAWRRLALRFMQPGPTLELAYGTGGFFVDLLAAGYAPVGIDVSPYMAHLAGQRLRRYLYPSYLTRAKAQSLPFPANSFVNVVATFPTEYIMRRQTLAEIYRVLDETGRLIIVAEGQLRGPWPLRPFIDWLYQVTGQRGIHPAKPLEIAAAHNFAARWEIVKHEGAAARLLIAVKRK